MDFHTDIIAFSIVCGQHVRLLELFGNLLLVRLPNAKSIASRALVIVACSGAVTYLMLMPAKSSSPPSCCFCGHALPKSKAILLPA